MTQLKVAKEAVLCRTFDRCLANCIAARCYAAAFMTVVKYSNINILIGHNTGAPAPFVTKIPQITEFMPNWLAEP